MATSILITGICGFVGSELALGLLKRLPGLQVVGIDNLGRAGSHVNAPRLRKIGVKVVHGDVRCASDLESITGIDWIIDAAALPSVLAGLDGSSSSRQLIEHNLIGTLNLLELAKRTGAGLALMSTSRVYAVRALSAIPVKSAGFAFAFDASRSTPAGVSAHGIDAAFSTEAPVSLYGSTKLASEVMALEYAHAYDLPLIINRCGVLAGAGQFGTAEQGIFSFWLRAYALRRPLRYIGFGGNGFQVRDALHPDDLSELLMRQMNQRIVDRPIWNVGGGPENSMSLAQASQWCAERFGPHEVTTDTRPRPYDAPWIVMDARQAQADFDWQPQRSLLSVLDEIAEHHRDNPHWLDLSTST